MGLFRRLSSEYAYLAGALRALRRTVPIARNKNRVFPDVVEELAERFADRPALISDQETLSYRDYDRRANRYARWARAHGVKKGDTVALLMPNRPEYLVIWLGIARAGGVVALINTNLAGTSLAHCINLVVPRHVIVDAELFASLETALPELTGDAQTWVYGPHPQEQRRIDREIESHSAEALSPAERVSLTTDDPCLYIFTSGTTGLPKAANINHYRVQAIMNGFSGAMNATASDRMYVCLPLYHSTGGLIAVGATLTVGGSVVIRERFSSSQFWDDVVGHQCTLFQYVGELCRYLLNSPTHPRENEHRIRLCCGNGLRPDIWSDFRNRFRIPKILEFYAATEGNAVLFNFDGMPGSVGRVPKWLERRFLFKLIRYDIEAEREVRGVDGFCIECDLDEAGELISEIVDDPSKPSQRFEGYTDPEATERKILRDAFSRGDRWFRTGDLLRKDALGYYYFVDRIGDTFRWKGENVATSEVSEIIGVFPGVRESTVYGVRVENHEGRAGMAALVVEDADQFDLDALRRHLHAQLPAYARPLFLRIRRELEVTGTFKQRKVTLVEEGFDPETIDDVLYFDHPEQDGFKPLTPELYRQIQSSRIRLCPRPPPDHGGRHLSRPAAPRERYVNRLLRNCPPGSRDIARHGAGTGKSAKREEDLPVSQSVEKKSVEKKSVENRSAEKWRPLPRCRHAGPHAAASHEESASGPTRRPRSAAPFPAAPPGRRR